MIIAVDLATITLPHAYDAEALPLRKTAVTALRRLKAAGHVLVLTSSRANRALLVDPLLDPLVRAGVVGHSRERWDAARATHRTRYRAMLAVGRTLGDVFAAVDDGAQGPISADLAITPLTAINGARIDLEPRRAWREAAITYGSAISGPESSP